MLPQRNRLENRKTYQLLSAAGLKSTPSGHIYKQNTIF